jgi:hypothetical protein
MKCTSNIKIIKHLLIKLTIVHCQESKGSLLPCCQTHTDEIFFFDISETLSKIACKERGDISRTKKVRPVRLLQQNVMQNGRTCDMKFGC